jgi:hypothetical protein
MPNRILREGILYSDAVNSLGFKAELFYRRLMSVVDDFGRFDARADVLRSRCYPLLTHAVREADISRWLAVCQSSGLIRLYDHAGCQYGLFLKLGEPRAKTSKLPPPPGEVGPLADNEQPARICAQTRADDDACAQMRPPYALRLTPYEEDKDPHNPPQAGESVVLSESPESAKRGKRNPARRNAKGAGPEFEAFWAVYPRKVAKVVAVRAWIKLDPDEAARTMIMKAIERHCRSEQWRKGIIPHPATWLNQRRWEDEETSLTPVRRIETPKERDERIRKERQRLAEGKELAIPLGEFAAKLAARRSGQQSGDEVKRELKPGEIPP